MDQLAVGKLPDDCQPKIAEIVGYWRSIHPACGLPGRKHMDPVDIQSLLPNVCLIDVPKESNEFVIRLMGTKLVEFFGGDYTGALFSDVYQKAEQSQAYRDLCDARKDRLFRWRRGPASFVKNREHVIIERVFLPFACDGASVNMYLAILLAKYGDGIFQ